MPRKKQVDIVGQRFGKVEVIKETGTGRNYDRMFLCRCDCGTEKTCSMNDLRRGSIQSCGCSNDDRLKLMQQKNESSRVNGVVPHHLKRKITHNKSTGVKGVSAEYTKKGTKIYRAYISVGGKRIRLGSFLDLGDAVEARKKAEALYHEPILQKAELQSEKLE
ncbi:MULTISPECIES: hypothetical protein [Paenibacillus]|uniref:hypothetical protein n=1 Tax=Paenibacillus TaxID=44249 RepID=UPI00117C82C5|nr:hypothetical protein [Paenibacillus rhizosphaerae]